ncbi:MAG: saccharopine dehydrogenase C-terminal domain-containing protein [Acidobacteriota bacterium]|nr:saccharopine dehydrogenase C-terminal domain-containing protein [Acidobacteriota bacterium]
MKTILVLGAGRVARPCVRYLLEHTPHHITVVDQDEGNLAAVTRGDPRATALQESASDATHLLEKTSPDVVVNLLPAPFMLPVAEACVKARIDMINASYIKDEMQALDGPAREAGILLLCELGLDPGIDHMSAAQTIRRIHDQGGEVESFWSCCGAIPSADANTNPFGYKLSWSPSGLVGASTREARILRHNRVVIYPPGETFRHCGLMEVEGLGWFEQYANANSLPYVDLYGMPEAKNVYRGTIRHIGWSETVRKMLDLGLFEEDVRDLGGLSYRQFTARLAEARDGETAEEALRRKLQLEPYSSVFHKLLWLGLLSETPIPLATGSHRDVVAGLYLEKLVYAPGERDLVVMEHRYDAFFPEDGRRVRHTSTLIDYGDAGGETSIARTTGLPPAIGARLVLEGRLSLKGVQAPVHPDICGPSLAELERLKISFREKDEPLGAN